MLTVGGEIEYEPPQHKVYRMTDKAVILIAGDTSDQWIIGQSVARQIKGEGITDIAEMANLYAKEFASHRRKEAEARLLAPLGLTFSSLIDRQDEMALSVVEDLNYKLQHHRLDAAAILAGIDQYGAHIYSVHDPGIETCHDREGFAAIGIGASHALSHFMFSKYMPMWSMPHALLLTYAAKKRSEVAPGVGSDTDMFFVETPTPTNLIRSDYIGTISTIYEESKAAQDGILEGARERMTTYAEAETRKAAEEKRKKSQPPATEATEQKVIRGDFTKGEREDRP